MPRTVGIDLGTTNSAIAFMEGPEPRLIPNNRGNRITPSVVAFGEEVLVGESAKNQAIVNAERTVQHVKRRIGSPDPIEIDGRRYTAEEISSYILRKLKTDAEAFLGESVSQAVITVPAHFGEAQRSATKEAGRLAGLDVRRIVNEPTAAALAYAARAARRENILVYDLGGGTFDVTCLVKDGLDYTVVSTTGDGHLGGVDFDTLLTQLVLKAFEEELEGGLGSDPILLQQLDNLVEAAKIELSSSDVATIAMPFISGRGRPVHLSRRVLRDELNDLIESRVEHTIELTRQALSESGFGAQGVDRVVFAGGSTRIPLVRNRLLEELGLREVPQINPDEVVALGAAVQASLLDAGTPYRLHDVTGYALGVEIEDDVSVEVIPRNAALPAKGKRTFTTVSDSQTSVEINVLQGESEQASENSSLGRFLLSGIQEGKKGKPRIEVTFSVDVDGIAHISAEDTQTKARHAIVVTPLDQGTAGSRETQVLSLARRLETLLAQGGAVVDPDLREESQEMIVLARKAVESAQEKKLPECKLALETLIGEVNLTVPPSEMRRA
jgi:molecular chaperone DnaK